MEVQPGASEPPHGRFGGLFAELQHRCVTDQLMTASRACNAAMAGLGGLGYKGLLRLQGAH